VAIANGRWQVNHGVSHSSPANNLLGILGLEDLLGCGPSATAVLAS
jgi:hypothetical protein